MHPVERLRYVAQAGSSGLGWLWGDHGGGIGTFDRNLPEKRGETRLAMG